MPRNPDVWQRGNKGPWYAWIDGKRQRVADATTSKPQARSIYYAMRSAPVAKIPTAALTVKAILELWRVHAVVQVAHGERVPKSLKNYDLFNTVWVSSFGNTLAASLKPQEVSRVIHSRSTWGPGFRDSAVKSIKAVFRWAVKEGLLAESPVRDLARDTRHRREVIFTTSEARDAIAAAPPELAAVLRGLWLTGCRPGELYGLTIDRVDLAAGTWSVLDKNRRKTKRDYRTVYLSPPAVELTRGLIEGRAEGFVFLNSRGGRWRDDAIHNRMKKLAIDHGTRTYAAYEFRHLWATDAILSGIPIAMVAELMGHRDWKMLERHYSHLTQRADDLRAAVSRLRPT